VTDEDWGCWGSRHPPSPLGGDGLDVRGGVSYEGGEELERSGLGLLGRLGKSVVVAVAAGCAQRGAADASVEGGRCGTVVDAVWADGSSAGQGPKGKYSASEGVPDAAAVAAVPAAAAINWGAISPSAGQAAVPLAAGVTVVSGCGTPAATAQVRVTAGATLMRAWRRLPDRDQSLGWARGLGEWVLMAEGSRSSFLFGHFSYCFRAHKELYTLPSYRLCSHLAISLVAPAAIATVRVQHDGLQKLQVLHVQVAAS